MGRALVCETVTGRSMDDLLNGRDAVRGADMVELRLDGVADVDVAAALAGRRLPAIVTCRPAWEGGRFEGSEEERRTMLGRAFELGAEHVDIEWRALRGPEGEAFSKLAAREARRTVVSSHDFDGVPADLEARVRDMRATGVATIKVAVTASRLTDTLALVEIAKPGDAVVIGMGEAGVPSRLLATRYRSVWTYAGQGVAPGQIPTDRMVREFRFRAIGPDTRVFGVVSTNALHSLSPVMHNAAFDAGGIDAVYVPLRAADFSDFLEYASVMGIEGASVTIPYKRDALRAATTTDNVAREVGAANALRRGPRGWEATNTDVDGFLAPLEDQYPGSLRDARASVLGAGGSARAVVKGLVSRMARVTVHARRTEQAREVVESLGETVGDWPVPPGSWDLLVNCTPLGGAGRRDESPLPGGPFAGRMVYDLTYGDRPSALLRAAGAAGCRVLDGLPMLVAQAERQFEWWTGQRPTRSVMAAAAQARLQAMRSSAVEGR